MSKAGIKKSIYTTLGCISVCLGVIGIFVPLMPTTIFLIIATWFFFWADKTYLQRLLQHKKLGPLVAKIPARFLPKDILQQ